MVAGDLVNTASRIQSAAEPGTVLVGEATKRADRGGHRLRGRRRARPQGQGESAALWRALRVMARARRRAAIRRASSRRSSAATGSCGSSRSSSTPPPTSSGPAGLGHRDRRYRQVPAGVGVREVRRRARRRRVLAPRPLPLLRRGRRLLGARRDGAHALRDRRGRAARTGARQARAPPSTSTSPTRRSAAGSSRASPTCSASRRASPATRRTCSRPGASLFERLAEQAPSSWSSRTSSGPTRASLDFIEYLLEWSRGQPIFVLALARPELRRAAPRLGLRQARRPRSTSSRSRTGDGASCSTGSSPACRTSCASGSSRAPRAFRSTRSRRSACCSTAGLLVREGTSTARPATIDDARGAGDAARAGRRPARRARAGGAAARPGRGGPRQDLHRAGVGALSGTGEAELDRLARLARPQGGPLRAGRPALARARAVRLPPGHRQAGRLRDDLQARAQGEAPGGRRGTWRDLGRRTRTRSSRSSPRTTSTPIRLRPTPTTRPRSRSARAICSSARASGPRRSAPPPRRCARSSARSS